MVIAMAIIPGEQSRWDWKQSKYASPRAVEVPDQVTLHGFQSQIVGRYLRASEATRQLFARLYLKGLATKDSTLVFRLSVIETTPLSTNVTVGLKEQGEK